MKRDISFIQSPSHPDFFLLMRLPATVSVLPAFAAACEASQKIDIAVQDWDVMFCAVLDRLSHSVDELAPAQTVLPMPDPACQHQAVVLECVQALAQLHTALKHDQF